MFFKNISIGYLVVLYKVSPYRLDASPAPKSIENVERLCKPRESPKEEESKILMLLNGAGVSVTSLVYVQTSLTTYIPWATRMRIKPENSSYGLCAAKS